jgi:hypothetical protein
MKTEIIEQIINDDIRLKENDSELFIKQMTDVIIVDKGRIPELIKILQSFVIMLLLSVSVFAQTHTSFLTEIGTTDFRSQSYAGMIGFTNFQDDSFHAGVLYKNYGKANRIGARVNVTLNLNDLIFVFIQSDIFAKTASQDNASFMENSVGLGFRLFKGLSVHAGYQMEDYNPVTKIRSEDRLLVKLGYKIKM